MVEGIWILQGERSQLGHGFNMLGVRVIQRGDLDLIREYEIFHKEDPQKKVRLRTIQTLTVKQIKEKIVRNGLFKNVCLSELRVNRINR